MAGKLGILSRQRTRTTILKRSLIVTLLSIVFVALVTTLAHAVATGESPLDQAQKLFSGAQEQTYIKDYKYESKELSTVVSENKSEDNFFRFLNGNHTLNVHFTNNYQVDKARKDIAEPIVKEFEEGTPFIIEVGLGQSAGVPKRVKYDTTKNIECKINQETYEVEINAKSGLAEDVDIEIAYGNEETTYSLLRFYQGPTGDWREDASIEEKIGQVYATIPSDAEVNEGIQEGFAVDTYDVGGVLPAGFSSVSLYYARTVNKVIFDANGGVNGPGVLYDRSGIKFNIKDNPPTRAGYDFKGWFTEPEGGEQLDPATYEDGYEIPKQKETKYYAHWELNNPNKKYITVVYWGQNANLNSPDTFDKSDYSYISEAYYEGPCDSSFVIDKDHNPDRVAPAMGKGTAIQKVPKYDTTGDSVADTAMDKCFYLNYNQGAGTEPITDTETTIKADNYSVYNVYLKRVEYTWEFYQSVTYSSTTTKYTFKNLYSKGTIKARWGQDVRQKFLDVCAESQGVETATQGRWTSSFKLGSTSAKTYCNYLCNMDLTNRTSSNQNAYVYNKPNTVVSFKYYTQKLGRPADHKTTSQITNNYNEVSTVTVSAGSSYTIDEFIHMDGFITPNSTSGSDSPHVGDEMKNGQKFFYKRVTSPLALYVIDAGKPGTEDYWNTSIEDIQYETTLADVVVPDTIPGSLKDPTKARTLSNFIPVNPNMPHLDSNYIFAGWAYNNNPDSDVVDLSKAKMPLKAQSLYAKWKAPNVNVTFNQVKVPKTENVAYTVNFDNQTYEQKIQGNIPTATAFENFYFEYWYYYHDFNDGNGVQKVYFDPNSMTLPAFDINLYPEYSSLEPNTEFMITPQDHDQYNGHIAPTDVFYVKNGDGFDSFDTNILKVTDMKGNVHEITATPNAGYKFSHWEITFTDASGWTTITKDVKVLAPAGIKATFVAEEDVPEVIDPPESVTEVYCAKNIPVAQKGIAKNGVMMYYATTSEEEVPTYDTPGWSSSIPQEKDANKYYIWYYVKGPVNNTEITKVETPSEILRAEITIDVTGKTVYKKYTGKEQSIVNAECYEAKCNTDWFESNKIGCDVSVSGTGVSGQTTTYTSAALNTLTWVYNDDNVDETFNFVPEDTTAKLVIGSDAGVIPPEVVSSFTYDEDYHSLIKSAARTTDSDPDVTFEYGLSLDPMVEPTDWYQNFEDVTAIDSNTYYIWYYLHGNGGKYIDKKVMCDRVYISPASINVPTWKGTELVYSGWEYWVDDPDYWNNWDIDRVEATSGFNGTNAGKYYAKFNLIDKNNYRWTDNTAEEKTVEWDIQRAATLVCPTWIRDFIYDGAKHNVENFINGEELGGLWRVDNESLTIDNLDLGGTVGADKPGTYKAIWTPQSNYAWTDGTYDGKEVEWGIVKGDVEPPTAANDWTWDNAQHNVFKDAAQVPAGYHVWYSWSYIPEYTPSAWEWTDNIDDLKVSDAGEYYLWYTISDDETWEETDPILLSQKVTVNKRTLHPYIQGQNVTFPYDGNPHAYDSASSLWEGAYTITPNTDLDKDIDPNVYNLDYYYPTSDFSISQTNAGTVRSDHYEKYNWVYDQWAPNYNNVEFQPTWVEPYYSITVTPRELKVFEEPGIQNTIVYDGQEHSLFNADKPGRVGIMTLEPEPKEEEIGGSFKYGISNKEGATEEEIEWFNSPQEAVKADIGVYEVYCKVVPTDENFVFPGFDGTGLSYKHLGKVVITDNFPTWTDPVLNEDVAYDSHEHPVYGIPATVSGGTVEYGISTTDDPPTEWYPEYDNDKFRVVEQGTYHAYIKITNDDQHLPLPNPVHFVGDFKVLPPYPVIHKPGLKENWYYDGTSHKLIADAGSCEGGTITGYITTSEEEDPPQGDDPRWKTNFEDVEATDVGIHTVWIKVQADEQHSPFLHAAIIVGSVETYKPLPVVDPEPTLADNWYYDQIEHQLITASGAVDGGTMYYCYTDTEEAPSYDDTRWTDNFTNVKASEVGKHYVYRKVVADDQHSPLPEPIKLLGCVETYSAKTQLVVPTWIAGSVIYDGNAHSPNHIEYWNNFDPEVLTMENADEQTNAGTYEVNFAIKDSTRFEWEDGTTDPKPASWTIGQAKQNVSFDPEKPFVRIGNALAINVLNIQGGAKVEDASFAEGTYIRCLTFADSYVFVQGVSTGKDTLTVKIGATQDYEETSASVEVECADKYYQDLEVEATNPVAQSEIGTAELFNLKEDPQVTWTTEDTDKIEFDQSVGTKASYKAVAAGEVRITAHVAETEHYFPIDLTVDVTITPKQTEKITLQEQYEVGDNPINVFAEGLSEGRQVKWEVIEQTPDAGEGDVVKLDYSTSNPVLVNGLNNGTAKIKITALADKTFAESSAETTIKVFKKPKQNITFDPSSINVEVGDDITVEAKGLQENPHTNWSISDSNVANITTSSIFNPVSLRGMNTGKAILTIITEETETYGRTEASIEVNVPERKFVYLDERKGNYGYGILYDFKNATSVTFTHDIPEEGTYTETINVDRYAKGDIKAYKIEDSKDSYHVVVACPLKMAFDAHTGAALFRSFTKLTSVDFGDVIISHATDFVRMFNGCISMQKIKLSTLDENGFDISNVTDFRFMFADCRHLVSITFPEEAVMGKKAELSNMFYDCDMLNNIYVKDGTDWSQTECANSSAMFEHCKNLPNFLSTKTNKERAYCGEKAGVKGYLTPLSAPLDKVYLCERPSDFMSLFNKYNEATTFTFSHSVPSEYVDSMVVDKNLDGLIKAYKVDNGNGSYSVVVASDHQISFSKTSGASMFRGFTKLTHIDFGDVDVEDAESFVRMFQDCTSLENINLTSTAAGGFRTPNIKDVRYMFFMSDAKAQNNLKSITFDDAFAPQKTTQLAYMFANCNNVTSIYVKEGTSWVDNTSGSTACMFENCNCLPGFSAGATNHKKAYEGTGGYFTKKHPAGALYLANRPSDFKSIINKYNEATSVSFTHQAPELYDDCINVDVDYSGLIKAFKVKDSETSYHVVIAASDSYKFSATTGASLFRGFQNLQSVDFGDTDVSEATSFVRMFQDCYSLVNVNLTTQAQGGFNTAKVSDFKYMFFMSDNKKVSKLASITFDDSFIVSDKAELGSMFCNCSALGAIYVKTGTNWSTNTSGNVKDMFTGCTYLPNFLSSAVDNRKAYEGNGGYFTKKSDTGTPHLANRPASFMSIINDYKEATSVQFTHEIPAVFESCINVDVERSGKIKAYQVKNETTGYHVVIACPEKYSFSSTTGSSLFRGFSNLQSVNFGDVDISEATGFVRTFQDCNSLESIDLSSNDPKGFNTANVTTYQLMFYSTNPANSKLKSVTFGNGFTMNKNATCLNMFEGCSLLSEIRTAATEDWTGLDSSKCSLMFKGCVSLPGFTGAKEDLDNTKAFCGIKGDITGFFVSKDAKTNNVLNKIRTKTIIQKTQ